MAIQSSLPLPELSPGGTGAFVVVQRVDATPRACVHPAGWSNHADGARYVHDASGAMACVTIDPRARAITVRCAPHVPDAVVRLLALGPGLAGWLTLAGQAVLHANTVRLERGDVALVGPGGVGKSTVSAALVRDGASLVADDIAVVDGLPDAPTVRPGFGRIKLWDDALAAFGEDPEGLPRVHPAFDKRGWSTPVVREAGPLAAIAALERGPAGAERLSGSDALQTLLAHARVPELIAGEREVGWLRACAAIARATPVWRVRVPGPWSELPRVLDLLRGLG